MSDNTEVAIEIKDIHKEFILPQSKNSTLKQAAVNIVRKNKKVTQKVLDGINFEVHKGDFIGIIGRNGCGKSTLLKLIAGVYEPTAGNIYVHGGLTPFIELGVGFNPELSGHDNVYLNGALLGFNHKQMDEMYDEIVAFAELGPFMDQKLKNYSSGMQVRLAFSIAIKAENDILLFDEVLAVGDSNFQEKCIRQFNKFKFEGKTIILVTHSMDMVEKFCNRAILINQGKIEYDGDVAVAIDKYQTLNLDSSVIPVDNGIETSRGVARINSVDILDHNKIETKVINPNEDYYIRLHIISAELIKGAYVVVRVCELEHEIPIIKFSSKSLKDGFEIKKGKNTITLRVKNNPLLYGKYYIATAIFDNKQNNKKINFYIGSNQGNYFIINNSRDSGLIGSTVEWIV